MDDMLKDFVVEAMDLAVNVEEHLLALERDPDNKETLNAVFRSFHTIKGGAGFMGLPAMVTACHLTENLFDALRTGACRRAGRCCAGSRGPFGHRVAGRPRLGSHVRSSDAGR